MSSKTTNGSIALAASRLRLAVWVAIALMALLYAAARFGLDSGTVRFERHQAALDTPAARAIADVSMVLLIVALVRLTQMLGRIAAGELFSPGVIAGFRSFAFWLLLMALTGLFAPAIVQLVQAALGGPSRIEMRIDFRAVLTVGVTFVLFLLARLLDRARGIDEENREFV